MPDTERPSTGQDPGAGPSTFDRLRSALADRYALEREIGRGGMAVVFLARDLRLHRDVAVKVLTGEVADSIGAARFAREVHLAAQLTHPHILAVHDAGHVGALRYYVMPYVSGPTLRRRLDRARQLRLDDVVRLTRDVASAIDHAHTRNIVHRDIKPENILLEEGQAVVADFGIARAIVEATEERLSRTGIAVGTAAYMSPEQASADRLIDGQSDIYSLGCVVYEMLAGVPPFAGSQASVLHQHRSEPPPPLHRWRPGLGEDVEAVVQRALAKTPADRWETAGAFADALARAVGGEPVTSRPGPRNSWWRRARRWWSTSERRRIAVGGALAAVIAAGALLTASGEWPPRLGDGLLGTERPAAPLDSMRYAVFPFRHAAGARVELGEDQLLHDALGAWRGIERVDPLQLADALARRGERPETMRTATLRAVAAEFGAGRFVWGEVRRLGDGRVRVFAAIYDAAREAPLLLRDTTVTMAAEQFLSDSLVRGVVERLLFDGLPLAAGVPVTERGTSSVPAQRAYLRAHAALREWNLAEADSLFRAATGADPEFAQAQLWLAQVRAWSSDDPARWREPAARAVRLRDRLGARDAQLAEALQLMSTGAYDRACAVYDALRRANPRDFAAWYGLAECNGRDEVVVRDPQSENGWRFRGDYHTAIDAYREAFRLLPSIHRAYVGDAYRRLRERLFVSYDQYRPGRALEPGAGAFYGLPGLRKDSIRFVPWSAAQIGSRAPTVAVITRNRDVFREIAVQLVAAFPQSADALEALALAMELVGDPAAIDTLARARRLATDSEQRIRLGHSEVRLLVKRGVPDRVEDIERARRLADSVLGAARSVTRDGSERLAALAALVGRPQLAATHARAGAGSFVIEHEGRTLTVPAALSRHARALEALAAFGVASDSLIQVERRFDELLARSFAPSAQRAVRAETIGRATILLRATHPGRRLAEIDAPGNDLLAMQRAAARGDTAAVRRGLAALRRNRARIPAGEQTLDAVLMEALLFREIGDDRAAAAWLDSFLHSLPIAAPHLLDDVPRAAALPRALAIRAELARRRGDPAAARLARAARTLWTSVDAELNPLLERIDAVTQ